MKDIYFMLDRSFIVILKLEFDLSIRLTNVSYSLCAVCAERILQSK